MRIRGSRTLQGRTAFVTGAAGGIGAATSRELVAAGANVVLADVDPEKVQRLADDLGPAALPVRADVGNRRSVEAAVEAAVAAFGAIDVCFANAGIAAKRPTTIAATPIDEFERIIDVDLLGVWRTVRACLPEIKKSGGYVLVTGSIYSFFNGTANAPYAMSKAGVEAFGRALRGELAGTGATAGVLYPGWVDTPLIGPSHRDSDAARQLLNIAFPGPLGTVIPAEQVAKAAVAGIRRRRARIACPQRWGAISVVRGPLMLAGDALIDHHRRLRSLMRELDA